MSHNVCINSSLTPNRTKALLLGSGELGKEVALELMRLGVYVIAADRYDSAPAMQVANKKVVFDMKDSEALKDVINRFKPDYVIPEIEAIATQTLVELEQTENLKVVPSAKAANITMNREAIRNLAANELKIPTSSFFFASTLEEVYANIDKVGYPCIMKPIMSSSGKGQSTIKCYEDIKTSFELACTQGRGGLNRVIVEGFIKFDREITLLTVSASDGIFFCEPIGHRQENGDYQESWQPQQLSSIVLDKSKDLASKVVKALGGYGIFGVELFICGDEVIFSEVSPRPHDTGMVTMISQNLSEFALHARALLGLPIGDIEFYGPSASAAVLATGDGCDINYKNLEQALQISKHSQLRIFGKPAIHGHRRLAVALCKDKDVQTAIANAKAMRDKIIIEVK